MATPVLRPSFGDRVVLLSKKQLAEHLSRSVRWVELRVADGMPSVPPTARFPHRRFRLGEVEAWLAGGGKPASTSQRLAEVEREVAALRASGERLDALEREVARLSSTIDGITGGVA